MQKCLHCYEKCSKTLYFAYYSVTKWLNNPFKSEVLSWSQISVNTSAYYYISQIYWKENWTWKQNRSVECGQEVIHQFP